MKFEIIPYEGALPVRFGASQDEVVKLLGEPEIRSKNFRGEPFFYLDLINIGFAINGGVMHVGFLPGCIVEVRGIDPFAPSSFERLLDIDGEPMEVVGIIVLLNLGITLTGFHDDDEAQKAVTAFARGEFDELQSEMQPFRR